VQFSDIHLFIDFKIKVLGCVIGRRRITIQPSPSGLAQTIIVKPIVFVHKWPFSANPRLLGDRSASIAPKADKSRLGRDRSGIDCAAYTSTPPRNAADFLELAENGVFWIGN
jgi:hypothetical protein